METGQRQRLAPRHNLPEPAGYLMVGQSISHYRIVEKLGEGGMGVVYKAEDLRLERPVALKFLATHLVSDQETRKRFEREAKAAAALTHPNIAVIHEIDDSDGHSFIVMEFVEGMSVSEKLAGRPLKLQEALDIAKQAAQGLQAAHQRGIVHRDIKSANLMVTPEGQVKIMDFGLAQLADRTRLTQAATVLGTPAYMSPEQAHGAVADHRTDIWSLGVVIYEMLTARLPFPGEREQAVLYAIENEEPEPVTGLRAGLPMELEWVLGKALAKDPAERYQHADELLVDLRVLEREAKTKSSSGRTRTLRAAAPPDTTAFRRSLRVLQIVAAAATLAFFGLLAIHLTQAPSGAPERVLLSFALTPSDLGEFPAISPNGRHIAYTTTGEDVALWVQDLDQDEPRRLDGTQGAFHPFWSPDSEFIAYFASEELRKVSVRGGPSGLICRVPSSAGTPTGTWSLDGESIIFTSGAGGSLALHEVSSQGGSPEDLRVAEQYRGFGPKLMQGADRLLLSSRGGQMYIQNLDTGQTEGLGPGAGPVYSVATGHLIYQAGIDGYDLWARPFSSETHQFTGPEFPVRQNAGQASVSDDGTLAFLERAPGTELKALVWRSRTGESLETVGQPQPIWGFLTLSPDGERIAVTSTESGGLAIWVHDLIRSRKYRLTFEQAGESHAAWSPTGREILYRLIRVGATNAIMRKAADGSDEAVALVESENVLSYPGLSRDGRYLVYREIDDETGQDIRYVEMGTDGVASDPVDFLATPAQESRPKLSPNGRFLAYESNESGRTEIYVRRFPDGGGKRQASVNGGFTPLWGRGGKELYYVNDGALMSVSVFTEQGFSPGQPQRLFESSGLRLNTGGNRGYVYDVSPDGQRFLLLDPVREESDATEQPKIRIIQNWSEEFRDRERD